MSDSDEDGADSGVIQLGRGDQDVNNTLATTVELTDTGEDDSVKASDSVSQTSSNSSSVSTASRLAEVSAKRAALMAEQQLLEERTRLEMVKRRLDLRVQLAAAAAEEDTLRSQLDPNYSRSTVNNSVLNPNAKGYQPRKVSHSNDSSIAVNSRPNMNNLPSAHVSNSANVNEFSQLNDNFSQMLSVLKLPQVKLPSYDGSPIKFHSFINNFNASVGNRDVADNEKLNILVDCCVGPAAKVIESCARMEPSDGYRRALELLYQRFGDPFTISKAWTEKVTNGGKISFDGQTLLNFSDDVRSCMETLKAMNALEFVNSQDKISQIFDRLPHTVQGRWRKEVAFIRSSGRLPNFQEFSIFLDRIAVEFSDPVYGVTSKSTSSPGKPRQSQQGGQFKGRSFTTQVLTPTRGISKKCLICSKDHSVSSCPTFLQLKPHQRLKIIREKGACFNCLDFTNHNASKCVKPNKCNRGCTYKHSSLIHDALMAGGSGSTQKEESHGTEGNQGKSAESKVTSCVCTSQSAIALPIVSLLVKSKDGEDFVETKALLDTGSNRSFCSSALLKKLSIPEDNCKDTISFETLTGENNASVMEVQLQVKGLKSKAPLIDIDTCYAVDKMPALDGEASMIIGLNVPEALRPLEVREGGNSAYAVRTKLGWVQNGPTSEKTVTNLASVNYIQVSSENNLLTQQVERFWALDSLPDNEKPSSIEDKEVLKIFDDSVVKRENHYQLPIPFKKGAHLADNYHVAEKRLVGLRSRLLKNKELQTKYKTAIDELVTKGFAEECKESANTNLTWYLPHHNVKHKTKPDKFRVVFDGSAEYANSSLNQQVLQGPDLTNSLVGVLLRFRLGSIAWTADIESMFHQIIVPEKDRNALRFLWFTDGDPEKEIKVYRMTRHLFGGVWSPTAANYALQKTAKDEENSGDFSSSAIETVLKNFYVDDCLASNESESEAADLALEVRELLKKGGFNLTKFNSNSGQVLNKINSENVSKSQSALGLQWNSGSDDTLQIRLTMKIDQITKQEDTRRGVLKALSSVYDPLGFASPFVLQAKLIFQDECRRHIQWDAKLTDSNLVRWYKWKHEVQNLQHFKIPRCLFPIGISNTVQLHIFADASFSGYAAVAYLRNESDGDVTTSLITSKARLAPIQGLTIPRLELLAAVLATRLGKLIKAEINLKFQVYYWTDSQIVLQYIRNTSKRFHTFVSHRVSRILDESKPEEWNHCRSQQNPADIPSRGLSVTEMINNPMWLQGPQFLTQSKDEWPEQIDIPELSPDDKEVKREAKSFTVQEIGSVRKLFNRYSSFNRLTKAVAWLRRFIGWIRKNPVKTESITVDEMKESQAIVYRVIQRWSYKEEIQCLQKEKPLSKSSSLYKLNPKLNDKGILEVQSRVNQLNPIILPRKDHVTSAIVTLYHEKSAHLGCEYVLTQIQKKFWIPKARKLIKSIAARCFKCKLLKQKPATQQMANLPECRTTTGTAAFEFIGVDCFGPFNVRRGRSTEKRYGCIFTCLSMRAIHLEKLDSLEASAFINGLRRFMARRGTPKLIKCDNGTNFVGATNELNEYLLKNEIKIEFNPPKASHMGGVWERMIRESRKVLNALLDNQTLTDESLNTLFCEVENIINNRPLTHASDNTDDLKVLTPNDLLLASMEKGVMDAPGEFVKEDSYKKQWRHVQFLASQFWKQWQVQYLKSLQLRQKWMHPQRNFQVDDLILLVDEQLPRQQWPLGRIVEVFPSKDGLIRSVEVKTAQSTLTRPITKLCLLETANK